MCIVCLDNSHEMSALFSLEKLIKKKNKNVIFCYHDQGLVV